MFGCGRVTCGVLAPTLMCLWQCMETKEKLMRYRLVTQRITLNKDNWTSLRYVTYVCSCNAFIYRPLGKMESAKRWPRELQRDMSNNIIGNKPLFLSKNWNSTRGFHRRSLNRPLRGKFISGRQALFARPLLAKPFYWRFSRKKNLKMFGLQLWSKQKVFVLLKWILEHN